MPSQLRNLTNTSTELTCTDDLFGLYFVDLTLCVATALWTLAATCFSSCLQACSRAWHPWGLSPVWLHVLRTCCCTYICMTVFDFRGYDRQLKTERHFRGRVNNNACKQSLPLSTLYCLMRCQIIMLHHSWNRNTRHPSCGDCAHWRFSPSLFLPQLSAPSRQHASTAASRRVLEPDILEVSHLCGWMYWERVCIAVFDFWAYDIQLKNKITF